MNEREIIENYKRIIREVNSSPGIFQYIQALEESLSQISPSRKQDSNRISVCLEYIKSIRREARRLEEKIKEIQEKKQE